MAQHCRCESIFVFFQYSVTALTLASEEAGAACAAAVPPVSRAVPSAAPVSHVRARIISFSADLFTPCGRGRAACTTAVITPATTAVPPWSTGLEETFDEPSIAWAKGRRTTATSPRIPPHVLHGLLVERMAAVQIATLWTRSGGAMPSNARESPVPRAAGPGYAPSQGPPSPALATTSTGRSRPPITVFASTSTSWATCRGLRDSPRISAAPCWGPSSTAGEGRAWRQGGRHGTMVGVGQRRGKGAEPVPRVLVRPAPSSPIRERVGIGGTRGKRPPHPHLGAAVRPLVGVQALPEVVPQAAGSSIRSWWPESQAPDAHGGPRPAPEPPLHAATALERARARGAPAERHCGAPPRQRTTSSASGSPACHCVPG